jgi:hypothetical protein
MLIQLNVHRLDGTVTSACYKTAQNLPPRHPAHVVNDDQYIPSSKPFTAVVTAVANSTASVFVLTVNERSVSARSRASLLRAGDSLTNGPGRLPRVACFMVKKGARRERRLVRV